MTVPLEAAAGTVVVQTPPGQPDIVVVQPTQMRRPWRSTVRTVFQALIALAVVWPVVIQALGLPDWAWIAGSLAVAAAITRLMALPGVETWLRQFLPWLAATPKE